MAKRPVIYTLEDKYARLLGEQRAWGEPQAHIAVKLAQLEAVILMFDHNWDKDSVKPIRPRLRATQWPGRVAGSRMAIKVLRSASEPLSAAELALAVYEGLGMEPPVRTLAYQGYHLALAVKRQFGDLLVTYAGPPMRWGIGRKHEREL